MTDLDAALAELASALEECSVRYILIGGLAVAAWGEPRSTLDVDVSVWADAGVLPQVVDYLSRKFRCRSSRPAEFVQQTRVLPLESASGVRIDVVFGVLSLQLRAIERAVLKEIAGRTIPVASVEKDQADASNLFRRFGRVLDRAYLGPKVKELADALARPDILKLYQRWTD